MSVIVAVKCREGIALAADSRCSFSLGDGGEYGTWDGGMKLQSLRPPHQWVGVAVGGNDWLDLKTLDCVQEIEASLPPRRLSVAEYAKALGVVLKRRASYRTRMFAIVAGLDEGADAGHVYAVEVPDRPDPVEHHAGALGVTYGGMREFIDRLLQGYDDRLLVEDMALRQHLLTPLALATMTLRDAVDLAGFLIRTTVDAQRFAGNFGFVASGGPIDVATITAADGLRFVERKPAETFGPESVTRRQRAARPAVVMSVPDDIAHLASYTVRPRDVVTSAEPGR